MIKTSYDSSVSEIDHRTILKFLPVDTFKDDLPYSDLGYPRATLRQASRISEHKLYACLDVKISGVGTKRGTYLKRLPDTETRGMYSHKVITTFPHVTVSLILGNEDGEKIGHFTGEYLSPDSIIIETKYLSLPDQSSWNSNREFFNPEKIKYLYMLDMALNELIGKMEDYTYY